MTNNSTIHRKVYIIAGATCTGKTAIAVALAQRLGTAIVSADSRQCYKEMTIGTAKPSPEILKEVKHYFIDEFPVTTSLTAGDFEHLALGYLDKIFSKNDTAVVCGGTGLYIKALCEGLDAMPVMDEGVTALVNKQYEINGIEWLQEAIRQEDPLYYETGEIHNPARLTRALIFVRSTGIGIKNYHTNSRKTRDFSIVKVAIDMPRHTLYQRINERVVAMMRAGLLEEVKALHPCKHLKNLQTVGYSELFDHIDGKCTLAEAIEKIQQNTRNYAKRQLTWFRKDKEIIWFPAVDTADIETLLTKVITLPEIS